MRYMTRALLLSTLLLATACQVGKDGEDGDAYGYLTGTSGIVSVDFSEIGITDSVIYYDQRYNIKSGTHNIYWDTGSVVYYDTVEIEIEEGEKGKDASLPLIGTAEDGEDGRDHLYYAEIISSTLYFDEEWVDHGDAPATLSPVSMESEPEFPALEIANVSLHN